MWLPPRGVEELLNYVRSTLPMVSNTPTPFLNAIYAIIWLRFPSLSIGRIATTLTTGTLTVASYWVVDIAVGGNRGSAAAQHGAVETMTSTTLPILRHSALNLLKQKQTCKLGIKNKRLNLAMGSTLSLACFATSIFPVRDRPVRSVLMTLKSADSIGQGKKMTARSNF